MGFKTLNPLLKQNIQVLLEKDPQLTDHGLRFDPLSFGSVKFGRFGQVLDPLDSPNVSTVPKSYLFFY